MLNGEDAAKTAAILPFGEFDDLGIPDMTPAQAAAAGAKKIPIGCQLYAVRAEFTKDVPGTLKTLADMGYEGVEFWGYGGTDAGVDNPIAVELASDGTIWVLDSDAVARKASTRYLPPNP